MMTDTEPTLSGYTVLQETKAVEDMWIVVRPLIHARSAEAAIRETAENNMTRQNGTYVAVPACSWKPVTVEAVQTTVLKLS